MYISSSVYVGGGGEGGCEDQNRPLHVNISLDAALQMQRFNLTQEGSNGEDKCDPLTSSTSTLVTQIQTPVSHSLIVFYVPSTARSFRDGTPHLLSLAKDVKLGKYTVSTGN